MQWIAIAHPGIVSTPLDGVQIGLAGMGCGPDKLTFPQRFPIGQALSSPHWARFATSEERAQGVGTDGVVMYDGLRPLTIVYKDGTIADQNEPIGFGCCTVTALAQAPQRVYEEKPCMDVRDISTPPPTPPQDASGDSGSDTSRGSEGSLGVLEVLVTWGTRSRSPGAAARLRPAAAPAGGP